MSRRRSLPCRPRLAPGSWGRHPETTRARGRRRAGAPRRRMLALVLPRVCPLNLRAGSWGPVMLGAASVLCAQESLWGAEDRTTRTPARPRSPRCALARPLLLPCSPFAPWNWGERLALWQPCPEAPSPPPRLHPGCELGLLGASPQSMVVVLVWGARPAHSRCQGHWWGWGLRRLDLLGCPWHVPWARGSASPRQAACLGTLSIAGTCAFCSGTPTPAPPLTSAPLNSDVTLVTLAFPLPSSP